MWDSIRSDCKGTSGCAGVDCNNCPFNGKVCNLATNTIFNAYKSIEIVENWVKEHPIKTNSQKFEEVFGFRPNVFLREEAVSICDGYHRLDDTFWNAEYKGGVDGE